MLSFDQYLSVAPKLFPLESHMQVNELKSTATMITAVCHDRFAAVKEIKNVINWIKFFITPVCPKAKAVMLEVWWDREGFFNCNN